MSINQISKFKLACTSSRIDNNINWKPEMQNYPNTQNMNSPNFTKIPMNTESKQQQLLSAVLENFRQQQLYTDVKLECDGGVVHSHKIILSASSPYFQTMFVSGMMEGNSSVINFKHWSFFGVEIIITFLYTGKTPRAELGRQLLKEVACISHLMQIEILFDYCWDILTKGISVENFAEMWSLAETYEINNCKVIIQFAEKNFKQISEDPNVLLMDEMDVRSLVKYIASVKPCEDVVRFILRWDINKSRTKGVIDLLRCVNLNEISNGYLHDVIRFEQYLQQDAELKAIFMEEAVARLVRDRDCKEGNRGQVFEVKNDDNRVLSLRSKSSLVSPQRTRDMMSETSIFALLSRNESRCSEPQAGATSGVDIKIGY